MFADIANIKVGSIANSAGTMVFLFSLSAMPFTPIVPTPLAIEPNIGNVTTLFNKKKTPPIHIKRRASSWLAEGGSGSQAGLEEKIQNL